MRKRHQDSKVPQLVTPLPGPKARRSDRRDEQFTSPSYTRFIRSSCERGAGAVIEDVDGNLFLDFTAGIAVTADRALPPARRRRHPGPGGQAACTCRGTDFYYQPQIDLAQRLAEVAPGPSAEAGLLHQQRGRRRWRRR